MDTSIFNKLGMLYYHYPDGKNLELVRLVGFQNVETAKVKYIQSLDKEVGTIEKVPTNTFSKYKALKPVGKVMISNVFVGKTEADKMDVNCFDVIISAYIDRGEVGIHLPNVVCRQSIVDLFDQIGTGADDARLFGMSTNQECMPEGIDFHVMMACTNVENSTVCNFYYTDTLEDILELVKLQSFNKTLEGLFNDHIKFVENKLRRKIKIHPGTQSLDGFCLTVDQLLKENGFWGDVEREMGIVSLNCELELDESGDKLTPDMMNKLSHIYSMIITDTLVSPYDFSVDIKDYKDKIFMLRDVNKKLYMVAYQKSNMPYVKPDVNLGDLADMNAAYSMVYNDTIDKYTQQRVLG